MIACSAAIARHGLGQQKATGPSSIFLSAVTGVSFFSFNLFFIYFFQSSESDVGHLFLFLSTFKFASCSNWCLLIWEPLLATVFVHVQCTQCCMRQKLTTRTNFSFWKFLCRSDSIFAACSLLCIRHTLSLLRTSVPVFPPTTAAGSHRPSRFENMFFPRLHGHCTFKTIGKNHGFSVNISLWGCRVQKTS